MRTRRLQLVGVSHSRQQARPVSFVVAESALACCFPSQSPCRHSSQRSWQTAWWCVSSLLAQPCWRMRARAHSRAQSRWIPQTGPYPSCFVSAINSATSQHVAGVAQTLVSLMMALSGQPSTVDSGPSLWDLSLYLDLTLLFLRVTFSRLSRRPRWLTRQPASRIGAPRGSWPPWARPCARSRRPC